MLPSLSLSLLLEVNILKNDGKLIAVLGHDEQYANQ